MYGSNSFHEHGTNTNRSVVQNYSLCQYGQRTIWSVSTGLTLPMPAAYYEGRSCSEWGMRVCYRVEVDASPAYELVMSLDAFLYASNKTMVMGQEWVDQIRSGLGAEQECIHFKTPHDPFILYALIWQAPGERDPEPFMEWLAGLSPGQLYELAAPYMPADAIETLRDLGAHRDHLVSVLWRWHEAYFRHVAPAQLRELAAEAAFRRQRVECLPPMEAVEEATSGLVVEPGLVKRVVLVPQHHFRPLNRFGCCGDTMLVGYPVEPGTDPGTPDKDLLRLARALSDESRLRILHFLADGPPRTFTDVLKFSGLAKNTVNHHLSILRASGLVRIHYTGAKGSERYTARRSAINEMGARLERFLDIR